jgi:hypothetical protein
MINFEYYEDSEWLTVKQTILVISITNLMHK